MVWIIQKSKEIFFSPLGDPPPSSFLQQIDYISLGVPLELGKGTPEKKKKNFFALKHFLEPIYKRKKNMYSLILEGEGGPTKDRENSLIFFFYWTLPLEKAILHVTSSFSIQGHGLSTLAIF